MLLGNDTCTLTAIIIRAVKTTSRDVIRSEEKNAFAG